MANYLELTFFQCICCRCCAYESKKPKTKPNISWHISHWRHTKNAHKFYLAKFQRVSPAKWQPKEVKRSAKSDNNNKLRALLECTMQVAIVCRSLAIPNPPIYPFSPPSRHTHGFDETLNNWAEWVGFFQRWGEVFVPRFGNGYLFLRKIFLGLIWITWANIFLCTPLYYCDNL